MKQNLKAAFSLSALFMLLACQAALASSWTQDSKTDWLAGTSTNLNLNVSPGSVLLDASHGLYQDATWEQRSRGYTSGNDISGAIATGSGAVSLTKTFFYNPNSQPSTSEYSSNRVMYDQSHNLLFIANSKVDVFDTKGTASPQDDERVFTYSSSSLPSIPGWGVYFMKIEGSHLYIHTNQGIAVFDTFDNNDPADDMQVGYYSTSTPAAIPDNLSYSSAYDETTGVLYVGTFSGVTAIDTKNTATSADDIVLITYNQANNKLTSNQIKDIRLDRSKGLVYAASYNGIDVIDTKFSTSTADDARIFTYSASSQPKLPSSTHSCWLDNDSHRLYVNTTSGTAVIDTNDTATTSDDTLIYTYGTSTMPYLEHAIVYDSYLATSTGLLYFMTSEGVYVLDTHHTDQPDDDTLAGSYTSPFSQAHLWWENFEIDQFGTIYITDLLSGVYALLPEYNRQSSYVSAPISSSTIQANFISWDAEVPFGTGVSIQTRSADAASVWQDEFDDGILPVITGLEPEYTFATTTETAGLLTFSGSTPDGYIAEFIIESGKPANYFPAGSVVKMKYRMNLNAPNNLDGYFLLDDWETLQEFSLSNEWQVLTLIAAEPFSYFNFDLFWNASYWDYATSSLQIDYITVEQPDGWSAWSNVYTNPFGSAITSQADDFLQYRAVLTSDTGSNTPILRNMNFSSGYQDQGSYTSPIYDTGNNADWGTLSWSASTSASTSISFKVRSGNNPDLSDAPAFADLNQTIENGITDLSSLAGMADGRRYVQYQASFGSLDPSATPALDSVSVSYEESPQQAGSQTSGNSSFVILSGEQAATTPVTDPATESATANYTQEAIQGLVDLSTVTGDIAHQISQAEAAAILAKDDSSDSSALSLFDKIVYGGSPLIAPEIKNSIINFIAAGTQTTLDLGTGERAGVVDSFVFAFGKYPRTQEDWSDIIKIANGRWPSQVDDTAEAKAAERFQTIYLREAIRSNIHDDAAIVIMAYGLRPAIRDLDKEAQAIATYVHIFNHEPVTASDWDTVRAIAYSGATR